MAQILRRSRVELCCPVAIAQATRCLFDRAARLIRFFGVDHLSLVPPRKGGGPGFAGLENTYDAILIRNNAGSNAIMLPP